MRNKPLFTPQTRQQFRETFQPSRIVLGVFPDPSRPFPNLISLCFNMHCSYKPPMMAFAVWRHSYSFKLLETAAQAVLAVPGENLASEVVICGTRSGADCNKWAETKLTAINSEFVAVPSIRECVANVELSLVSRTDAGDHLLVVGEVLNFAVNTELLRRPLLSVGPREAGYKILARQGIHRIGVVSEDFPSA